MQVLINKTKTPLPADQLHQGVLHQNQRAEGNVELDLQVYPEDGLHQEGEKI